MIESKTANGVPIKEWTDGLTVEPQARVQLENVARLPIVWPHLAVMPDVHLGYGATVGSVIPTYGAIIPSAVGVDIGCGMMAVRTNLLASHLPDNLYAVRSAIERAVPHGRTANGGPGDRGAWGTLPELAKEVWADIEAEYKTLADKHERIGKGNAANHLGTLGGGNHFIEVCLDEDDRVWVMLHSGSRGVGNRIGSHFIELAKNDMRAAHGNMPEDVDLCYLTEGTEHFDDYVRAVAWAQDFAHHSRGLMMTFAMNALQDSLGFWDIRPSAEVVNCHHNYVQKENHFGRDVWLTRKGAVSARKDQLGIIPGAMGAKSHIVRGLGNADAFHSCSHGAGRSMSRGEARRRFTVDDHVAATQGLECRKDVDVVDETPMAYKDIDQVMAAQKDLVEIVHTLRAVLCVKG